MPELIAKSALEARAMTVGDTRLAEVDPGPITSIALFPGGEKVLAKGLKALKLAMPAPNRMQVAGAGRLIWTGRDQAFLTGVPAPDLAGAALTDQTGGWTCLALSGPAATEVLARLTPLDLRLAAFPVGAALRAPLNHMAAVLMRLAEDQIEMLVFRSMARTAWHELEQALTTVHARKSLRG